MQTSADSKFYSPQVHDAEYGDLRSDLRTGSVDGRESVKHGDLAFQLIGDDRVELTEQDNKNIRRKTDKVILTILVWVYLLQILDKSILGYAATFGLKTDNHLTKNQYSLIGSISAIAQLCWQPFSSILLVKVPHRILMPCLVFGWGISATCMGACHSFEGLLVTRFFLGLFEAGCLPLFSLITSQWYRRAEQPIRVASWYGTNGIATIVAALLAFGFGHIKSDHIHSWQILFLFAGLVTVCTAPFVYWRLDNDIPTARFLNEHEKRQAIERLRANQTGTGTREFKLSHLWELALDPKTYLWFAMSMLLNVGASVVTVFGPLILKGLGFDKFRTSLLNIPFGALQVIIILTASFAAQKAKLKSAVLAGLMLPVVAGLVILVVTKHKSSNTAVLLVGYYLLAFLFGGNPLIVTWIVGNTGGTTKKSLTMSLYNAGSSLGNIIGPLLFNDKDAPAYQSGLSVVMAFFCTMVALVALQVVNLIWLNRSQSKKRVANGKQAVIHDHSMEAKYVAMDVDNEAEGSVRLGDNAFLDLTDRKNDEFIYVY